MEVWPALQGLVVLDLILLAVFIAVAGVMLVLYRLIEWRFCQVCTAVAAVWVPNLFLGVLPAWVTVFLMGQSVAGAAGMGRSYLAERFDFNDLPDGRRRLAKQFAYFGLILAGTLMAAGLLLVTGQDLPS